MPWALQMKATSAEQPTRLIRSLSGAILGSGGWVLSRGTTDAGMVHVLFEFERAACVDIYGILIAAGLELSHSSHLQLTALCQCTRNQRQCGTEIASVQLEIRTMPVEETLVAQGPEAV
jgi:hypothetical protein